MQVKIKEFKIAMDVKASGIEFMIHSPNGENQLGDLILTMTGLTWCKGKTTKKNGIEIKWEDFIQWAEAQTSEKPKKKVTKKQ